MTAHKNLDKVAAQAAAEAAQAAMKVATPDLLETAQMTLVEIAELFSAEGSFWAEFVAEVGAEFAETFGDGFEVERSTVSADAESLVKRLQTLVEPA